MNLIEMLISDSYPKEEPSLGGVLLLDSAWFVTQKEAASCGRQSHSESLWRILKASVFL